MPNKIVCLLFFFLLFIFLLFFILLLFFFFFLFLFLVFSSSSSSSSYSSSSSFPFAFSFTFSFPFPLPYRSPFSSPSLSPSLSPPSPPSPPSSSSCNYYTSSSDIALLACAHELVSPMPHYRWLLWRYKSGHGPLNSHIYNCYTYTRRCVYTLYLWMIIIHLVFWICYTSVDYVNIIF